ncbi:MAG: hypothetical protein C4331_15185 [Meiothermus sp.]
MYFAPERHFSAVFALLTLVLLGVSLYAIAQSGHPTVQWVGLITVVLVTVLLLVAPLSTLYQVTPEALKIRWLFGWLTLPRAQIQAVFEQEYRLTLRTGGIGAPGVAQGWFLERSLGSVQAYTGKGAGRGVFIQTVDGRRILLSPADLAGFVNCLRQQGYPVQ